MNKIVRFINQGLEYLFIAYGEDFGDGCYRFDNRLSDSFDDGRRMTRPSVLDWLNSKVQYFVTKY